MKTYVDIANDTCRQYGLEHPITIAVMAMIEKQIDPQTITDLLTAIETECFIEKEIF